MNKKTRRYAKQKISKIENIALPKEFLSQFEEDFGAVNRKKLEESFNEEQVKGIRFSDIKGKVIDLKNTNLKLSKIPYFDNSYYLNSSEKLGNSILHQSGMIYLQEPSSMLPVASVKGLDFKNKLVLDLCASPGGKTTQIASLMNNTGQLVSNEIDYKRAKVLFSNIERLGIKNCVILNESPQNLAQNFKKTFDFIFVDAPCSGEGMFRKNNEAIQEWNSQLKFFNSQRQKNILECADKMLKDEGVLIYSTCTFNTEENEKVVSYFTKTFKYKILPLSSQITNITVSGIAFDLNTNLTNTAHFFPFEAKGEGQFVAIMRKNKSQETKRKNVVPIQNLKPQEVNVIKQFFQENLVDKSLEKFDFTKIKNLVCAIEKNNDLLDFKGLNVLSHGVILGEIVNNRLEVHHQFFSAYGNLFTNYVNLKLKSEFLKKFAMGEELDLNLIKASEHLIEQKNKTKGYGVVMAECYSLGGYKLVEGKLKNRYPKALRTNNI